MRVELLARFSKKKTPEEIEEERVYRLTNSEPPEKEPEYEYDYISIRLEDISDIVRWDKEHTQIVKYNNIIYLIKTPYHQFTKGYEDLTGQKIHKI